MTLQVQVVSPERILWTGEAEMVTARTVEGGDISFLTGHSPFVGALEVCKVTVRPDQGDDLYFAVHGGFVEIFEDRVSLLSDVAESTSQIDVERATESAPRPRRWPTTPATPRRSWPCAGPRSAWRSLASYPSRRLSACPAPVRRRSRRGELDQSARTAGQSTLTELVTSVPIRTSHSPH